MDAWFCKQLDAFVEHFFVKCLKARWYWHSKEFQSRTRIHAHWTAQLDGAPAPAELTWKVWVGRVAACILHAHERGQEWQYLSGQFQSNSLLGLIRPAKPGQPWAQDNFVLKWEDLVCQTAIDPPDSATLERLHADASAGAEAEAEVAAYVDSLVSAWHPRAPQLCVGRGAGHEHSLPSCL